MFDTDINLQIHCVAYPMDSQYGSTDLPRYWMTLDKVIIWDYPKDFPERMKQTVTYPGTGYTTTAEYPYATDISDISNLIREYINTPNLELATKKFENDKWGLTDIFKAADRRIGVKRLMSSGLTGPSAKVLNKRLENKNGN